MGTDRLQHRGVLRQRLMMQLGVTTGQIEAIGIGQQLVMDRREEAQLGAHRPQQVEARAIGERESFITGHGNPYPGQQWLGLDQLGCGELHRRWQRYLATASQGFGGRIQAQVQVVQLAGLHQAQMAARQFDPGFPGQRAVPAQTFGQAAFKQLRMAHGPDAVGQDPGERQVRLVTRQPQRQGAKGLGHGGAVDHRQYRHAKVARQVGAGGGAVKQPHHALDQDQVRLPRGFPQQTATFLLAHHPHVQLIDRRATGALMDHRVEKVRAAFEYPDLAPQVTVQPGQGGGDSGFALA